MRRATVVLLCAVLGACATRQARTPVAPLEATEDDPDARARWYWEQRALPAGTIPAEVHRAAVQRELSATRALDDGAQWTALGPAPLLGLPYDVDTTNAGGRTLTVAIHPGDPNILFVGTAQGGIWKSSDRGASFAPVAEATLPTLAINILAFRPGDPTIMYAGTGEPNGSESLYGAGLLRSSDGGTTWEQLPVRGGGWDFSYAAISGLRFDPRNPDTMFVTTATVAASAPWFRTPPNAPQSGIFKSTDGGRSWTLLRAAKRYTLSDGPAPSAGFLDLESGGTAAPDLLYATELYGGIVKSEDGGATWTAITPFKANGFGDFPADVAQITVVDSASHRYKTVPRIVDNVNPELRRVELGVSPANPDVVYAGYSATLRVDWNGDGLYDTRDRTVTMGLLFRSDDRGATWRWLGSLDRGVPNYCGSQCNYDNVLTVDPNDPNDIALGGSFDAGGVLAGVQMPWHGVIWRSTDGGATWLDTTPHCEALASNARTSGGVTYYPCALSGSEHMIHPDIHTIVFGPSGELYVGSDGGLFRGTLVPASAPATRRRASGAPLAFPGLRYTWEELNHGIGALQFYRIASHPTDPNILLGGMQDNACGWFDGAQWTARGGGDGTVAAFDPLDPSHVYLGAQFNVFRSDRGGAGTLGAGGWVTIFDNTTVSGESLSFVPVFALDPVDPHIVYGATNKGLVRSTFRGSAMKRVLPATETAGTPTSISVSPADHNVVWLGTSTGHVYRYTFDATGNATMTDVSATLPARWVSRVAAGFDNASTVYAIFNGYDANTPATPGKVFVSTDGGVSWRNISSNLPDVPATAIALDPHDARRIWLGTDIAVYASDDGGATWSSQRRNMPVVGIQDLDYNATTGYLVAATHGRGAWRLLPAR
jgi:hypothetical protein